MTVTSTGRAGLAHPRIRRAFAVVHTLLAILFAISAAAVVFAVIEQSRTDLVNTVVWIRSIAVAAAAVILYAFAASAARGSVRAYRRLRLLSFLIPAGVVLLIVAPGEFPLWIKVEQAVCGALVLATGTILSRRHVRELFAESRARRSGRSVT